MNLSGQLFMLMICTYLRLNFNGIAKASPIKMYAALGENVTLSCGQKQNAVDVTLRWRREDGKLLSSGIRHVKGDQEIEQFYLLIIDIKEADYGTYICDWQTGSEVIQKITQLVLLETTSMNINKETSIKTGFFHRKNLYLIALAAGLTVVLCICCIPLMKKLCNHSEMKDNLQHNTENRPEEINYDDDISNEVHDDPFHYHLVDERKMTHYDYVSESDIAGLFASRNCHNKDTSSQQRSTTIGDVISSRHDSEKEITLASCQSQEHVGANKFYTTCEVNQNINSDDNKEKCFGLQHTRDFKPNQKQTNPDIEMNTTTKNDAYLNPYVPLRVSDMEYLNSYSLILRSNTSYEPGEDDMDIGNDS